MHIQLAQREFIVAVSAYSSERICHFLRDFCWPNACVTTDMHGIEKRIVYIIRSDVDPSRHYVGITK